MSKRLLILLILVFAIVPFASVNAQSANEGIDYCAILQTPDCQLLVDSANAMSEVSSFAFDMALNYDIAMDMQGFDNMNFALNGNGMIALDMAFFQELQNLAMNDPAGYMEQLPTMMDGIFSGFEGEAYFVLTLPDMFGAMVGTTELPLNLLMEDGVYAVDLASLEQALGEEPSGMDWVGLDLNGAFESMLGDFDMSSMMDPEAFGAMSMFNSDILNDVLSIVRLEDSNIDGVPVAVFESVFDYGAFLSSDEMRDTIVSMYMDMGMDQETIDMTLSMLSEIRIRFHQYIGLNDSYAYRFDMEMDFAIDGEMMGDPSMDSMELVFTMVFDMSDFNVPVDIEIPVDAMIMPFQSMMGAGF